MISWITQNLLWSQGFVILVVLAGLACASCFLFRPGLYVIFILFLFCFYFFRNPTRVCIEAQTDPHILVCPSDGRVVSIESIRDGVFTRKVAIFLSPFDVHVNWTPLAGTIEKVVYHEGEFKMAFLPKSSELNERNDLFIKTEDGMQIKVRQIAGTIARVIVCWMRENEKVRAGEKFGMIKFGSRIEIFLPSTVSLAIKEGEYVYGGRTVLGKRV